MLNLMGKKIFTIYAKKIVYLNLWVIALLIIPIPVDWEPVVIIGCQGASAGITIRFGKIV